MQRNNEYYTEYAIYTDADYAVVKYLCFIYDEEQYIKYNKKDAV